MEIISHRGLWKESSEKNTAAAFHRSFEQGFGTETDLRDHSGHIVISHDMAKGKEMKLSEFLDLANEFTNKDKRMTLALNIKSDGLVNDIVKILANYPNLDCFVFDMSIPDMRSYLKSNVPVFTRLSDVETTAIYDEQTDGIWLDNFGETLWFDGDYLKELLARKKVCIVSSELHGFSPDILWSTLKPFANNENLILCTDHPEQACQHLRS
ncbi:MAG: phosphodiesterase [Gammaproteobacteria bacterium]